jgi:sugar lactone lactonase YvrE
MGSALAIIDADRQLLMTETGLHVRDVRTGKLTLHTAIEADNAVTRSNDSRVHPSGAFWVGTMGKNSEQAAGAIYWFFKGEVRLLYPSITVPNSICFSSDGAIAYFVDSRAKKLMRVACDPVTGLPQGEPKVLVDDTGNPGSIDGSVVDADGNIWNARWGSARIDCYNPDGKIIRSVPIPAGQSSCPVFVGPDADRIVVTSAWNNLSEAARSKDLHAGKTFFVDMPVRGRFDPKVAL